MNTISKYVSGIVLTFAVLGCANPVNTNKGYKITGQIEGIPDSTLVRFYKIDQKIFNSVLERPIDSTYAVNNQFGFEGKLETPSLMMVTLDNPDSKNIFNRKAIPLVVENSATTINAEFDSIPATSLATETGLYRYANISIEGSKLQLQYQNYIQLMRPLVEEWNKLFMEDYLEYLRNKNRNDYPIEKGIQITNRIDNILDEKKKFIFKFIEDHRDNLLALVAANDILESLSLEELDDLTQQITTSKLDESKKTEFIQRLEVLKKMAPGATFMDFDFKTADGEPFRLSEALGKGKYVLLEFWASWCGPCRADIPHLKEVYDLYNPEGFEIVSVSMDHKNAEWLKALEDEKMPWTQISDGLAFNGDLAQTYNIHAIPTCLLIDPQGKIVTRNMRGSWMDKRLIDLYGNKFK